MATESDIQLLAEGSGPLVRTLAVGVPQPVDSSGASVADVTRQQQIISLADRRGDLVDSEWQSEVLSELRTMNRTLLDLVEQLG